MPEDKLSGLGLAHFASFYKGSWRANDWMWGRLDGASRLVDVLLDPWAIRLQLQPPDASERMTEQLLAIAGTEDPRRGGGHPRRARRARTLAARQRSADPARSEPALRFAAGCSSSSPGTSFRRSRGAARDDAERDGAAPDAVGLSWAATVPDAAQASDADVESALARLPLPKGESLTTEIGSNLLTRNVATVAAVSAAAFAAPHSGVPKVVRLVPRAARGLFLPFYGLTWGLTSKRPAWRVATLLAVVLAAAVVVWGVLADVDAREAAGGTPSGDGTLDQPPGWLHGVAIGVLIASIALGVLRGGWAGIVVAVGFGLVYLGLVLTPEPDDAS